MASAWGQAWSSYWGRSWGWSPTVTTGGGTSKRRRKPKYWSDDLKPIRPEVYVAPAATPVAAKTTIVDPQPPVSFALAEITRKEEAAKRRLKLIVAAAVAFMMDDDA